MSGVSEGDELKKARELIERHEIQMAERRRAEQTEKKEKAGRSLDELISYFNDGNSYLCIEGTPYYVPSLLRDIKKVVLKK